MALLFPAEMIKVFTLDDARRLIGEGAYAKVHVATHSDNGGDTLSGIIVFTFDQGPEDEVFLNTVLTLPLGLFYANDEYPAIMTLSGRTVCIELDPKQVRQIGSNVARYTFVEEG